MRTIVTVLLAATLMSLGCAHSAQAQRARVFVASYGSDSNPCTFGSPCKTFQQAVDVVAAGGEVTAIDSAGFGPITITKAVTITSPNGVEAGIVPAAGDPAIIVKTFVATTVVALRGLTLEGQGTASDGVQVTGTGRIEIFDCVIRNFTHDGINFHIGQTGSTNPTTVFVSNTIAVDNGAAGIEMTPINPFLGRGVFTNVKTAGNGGSGILLDGTQTGNGAFVDVQLSDIVSDSNGGDGITVLGVGDVKVDIRNSVSSNNAGYGLSVSNAKVSISNNSLVLNSQAGFSNINSGTLFSFQDNIIENNRLANVGTMTTDNKQ
jgi:hypothetical protein